MATVSNSNIRPQTARRVAATLTAAKTVFTDNSSVVKLCDVGPNSLSWLTRLSAAARNTVAAFRVLLYWSPDNGVTLNYLGFLPGTAVNTAPGPENDMGLTTANSRVLGAAGSFWVASDTGLTAGIVVNGEVLDA